MTACDALRRWLDDGMPGSAEAAHHRAHAASCVDCAAELDAALALDTLLARPIAAPAGFADVVMARVAAQESRATAAATAPLLPPALPWWARAAADPAAVLGFAVAALTLWGRDALLAAWAWLASAEVHGVPAALRSVTGALSGSTATVLARPEVLLGIMVAIAPALAWMSWRLWRWGEARV